MNIYFQLALIFTAIAAAAFAAEKFKSFFAPFYIIAGIILGPYVTGLVEESEVIITLGEIGMVFMLFFLGFEFSLNALVERKNQMLISGFIDFVVNFSLGYIYGLFIGLNYFQSIFIATAIYMSSSGIVTKSVLEMRLSKNNVGRLIMGIMIFEDIALIIILVIINAGITTGGIISLTGISLSLFKAGIFCFVLIFIAKKYPVLLSKIVDIQRYELLLLTFFAVVLAITSIGKFFGVSEALGAFFLGIAFSNTENSKKVENITITFRDLLGSVFFFSFGMTLDISLIIRIGIIVIPGILIAVGGKLLSSLIIVKCLKCEKDLGLFVGFITIPRGEFSLLVSRMAGSSILYLEPFTVMMVTATTFASMIVLRISRSMCVLYNRCIIFPRSHITPDSSDWGVID